MQDLINETIRTVNVIRYITPLREGGSLPAIAEADDGFNYVVKFRGAGQGSKSLIAELIAGEIARSLGLKIPEIVFANLDPAFGRTEPDEEIQDLLKASTGINLALHYLSGSIMFDPVLNVVDSKPASEIVWFDSFVANVDRTVRNTNMLVWFKELWLIDHGASLYYQHHWESFEKKALEPFIQIKDHVLLPWAGQLENADRDFHERLSNERIESIVSMIPEGWLINDDDLSQTAADKRKIYSRFLQTRFESSAIFVKEAIHARESLI
jgi:hypothetical protein